MHNINDPVLTAAVHMCVCIAVAFIVDLVVSR